jgi:hypothetical protein
MTRLVPHTAARYCRVCGFTEPSVAELVTVRNHRGKSDVCVCRACANRVAVAASDLAVLLDKLIFAIVGPEADSEDFGEATRLALESLSGMTP